LQLLRLVLRLMLQTASLVWTLRLLMLLLLLLLMLLLLLLLLLRRLLILRLLLLLLHLVLPLVLLLLVLLRMLLLVHRRHPIERILPTTSLTSSVAANTTMAILSGKVLERRSPSLLSPTHLLAATEAGLTVLAAVATVATLTLTLRSAATATTTTAASATSLLLLLVRLPRWWCSVNACCAPTTTSERRCSLVQSHTCCRRHQGSMRGIVTADSRKPCANSTETKGGERAAVSSS
jgi:hypothetical protein